MTPEWTPDQPLRADATDEQMDERYVFLMNRGDAHFFAQSAFDMAREFAAARVQEIISTYAAEVEQGEADVAPTTQEPTP
jgi:hypothetical protein